jgi:hypothetical protein
MYVRGNNSRRNNCILSRIIPGKYCTLFSSETTEPFEIKLGWNVPRIVL